MRAPAKPTPAQLTALRLAADTGGLRLGDLGAYPVGAFSPRVQWNVVAACRRRGWLDEMRPKMVNVVLTITASGQDELRSAQ